MTVEYMSEPFESKSPAFETEQENSMFLTLGRAISNVKDAGDAVSGKSKVYLKGLQENFRGALAWAQQKHPVARVAVAGSLVFQLATACSSRTISPEEISSVPTPQGEGWSPTPDTEETSVSAPVLEPTPTATIEPTQVPTPERPLLVKGSGGLYSDEQITMIEDGAYKDQEEMLSDWIVNYWGADQFENRPFDPESVQFQYKYVFNPLNPQEAGVLLEAYGEYAGKTFYVPIRDGKFVEDAPIPGKEDTTIPEGWGPLELTGGDYILSYMNGEWVRVDENANIVQKIDMDTGQWEAVVSQEVLNNLCTAFERFDPAKCEVSVEDIKSGRLAEIADAYYENVSGPFPPDNAKEVKKVDGTWVAYDYNDLEIAKFMGEEKGWINENGEKLNYYAITYTKEDLYRETTKNGDQMSMNNRNNPKFMELYNNPKKSPFRFEFINWTNLNQEKGIASYVFTFRVLEDSGKTKEIHFYETYKASLSDLTYSMTHNIGNLHFARINIISSSAVVTKEIDSQFPNRKDLTTEWLNTGVIPEEMGKILIKAVFEGKI